MKSYYNEVDPHAAQWLRDLIWGGAIAPGDVDERSILDVRPEDLVGYTKCHFFAGIGGWSYALRLAEWPDDRPVWTGSCPCQPFSVAGGGGGYDDERHLWPAFLRLITECRPAVIFGEQVAGPDGLEWLAGIRSDLEGTGYAVGAANLPAAGVGAPQRRQRLYWVADSTGGWRRQDWNEVQRPAGRCGSLGYWDDYRAVEGERGTRRIGPGTMPLVDGLSSRVERKRYDMRLRGYGNAIVPQIAARFIEAYLTA